jgi:hypothetical protein
MTSKTKTLAVIGITLALVAVVIVLVSKVIHSARVAHYPNIQGAWEGALDLQQAKLRVRLNLSKTNGVYVASGDSIDQGLKNIPVSEIVYKYPSFHFEMKSMGGVYDGKLNREANELSGTWKQGAVVTPLNFKLTTNNTSEALSEETYAPRADSDAQGIWEGKLAIQEGVALRIHFKIAEQPDGKFKLHLDSPDQGAKDIRASSVSYENSVLKAEFAGMNGAFEGRVGPQEIAGIWRQGDLSLPLTLQRFDEAKQKQEESGKSYSYTSANDLPGHWKGALIVQKIKLNLVFHIAKTPDGSLSAMMDSPDQGATGLPATSIQHTAPKVRIEWKGMGAVFDGTLKNGKISGSWRQGAATYPLVLSRT